MTSGDVKDAVLQARPTGWAEPDLSLVGADTVKPPELGNRLSAQLLAWCQETADDLAAPIDYVVGSLLAFGSAVIGNSRWAAPTASWSEPPQLWVALVGGPSWGKTPSMRPFIQATAKLEADDEPAWKETLGAFEQDVEYAKARQEQWRDQVRQAVKAGSLPPDMPASARTPEPPARPRLRITDSTVEEIGAILAGSPRGLLQTRDELAGWLGSMDRYGGNGADRAFYLECWNGGSYTIDRRKHGGQPVRLPSAKRPGPPSPNSTPCRAIP
jgi:hypothetical protein